ncbi:MAG TPA: nuclear transport factor 2 family protein [Candidatus Limnocylindria bacterium]|nr:nuclear transport factor 2 family protein [Candidatus Limnocylindria bacterium]
MNRSDVQEWLDRYVEAWRANDPTLIRGLFTEDAVYRYRPYGETRASRGHAEIVQAWLDDADAPGSWEARYEPYAVEGDRAVAVGFSRYFATGQEPEQTYHNVFLLRFAPDGRCAEFTELWMLEEES